MLFAGQEFPLNSRDDLGVEAKAFIIGEELVAGDYGIEVESTWDADRYIRTVEEGSSIREIFVGRVESRIQQTYRGDNPVFVDHPESGGVSGFG